MITFEREYIINCCKWYWIYKDGELIGQIYKLWDKKYYVWSVYISGYFDAVSPCSNFETLKEAMSAVRKALEGGEVE